MRYFFWRVFISFLYEGPMLLMSDKFMDKALKLEQLTTRGNYHVA